MKRMTQPELEAFAEQLDLRSRELEIAHQEVELEREQFQKFMKPVMHCFAKMIPELPLHLQQQFRTNRAAELEHLARALSELRFGDAGQIFTGDIVEKLRPRIEQLVAQCAQP